jgi:hypothetical protein
MEAGRRQRDMDDSHRRELPTSVARPTAMLALRLR